MKKYNKVLVGLDLGTDSVGWCATDENGKIIKKNGKSLWGYHGFTEAQAASKRRINRAQRRRYNRRQERIALTRAIFEKEIENVDKSFFYRLDNSFYHNDDREKQFDYTLFNSLTYTDSQYYKEYPTIYHLRNHLIKSDKKEDIRLVYLAIHHMIKYRGNFLNSMEEFHVLDKDEINIYFAEINNNIIDISSEEGNELCVEPFDFNEKIFEKLKEINEAGYSLTVMKEKYGEILNSKKNKYINNVIIPLMCGGNVKIGKTGLKNIVDSNKGDLCVKRDDFDQVISTLLNDNPAQESIISCFINCKRIYEFFLIGRLLGKHKFLSEAMVARYDEHKKQLNQLKKYVKNNLPNKYDEIFRVNDNKINNYVAYIGSNIVDGKKETRNHCTTSDFYAYIKKTLDIDRYKGDDKFILDILNKMDNDEYLLRQNSSNNGIFPYQLNKLEMKIILQKQSKYYPFLLEKSDGYTNIEKLISILEYRIPYYVGPLISFKNGDPRSKFSWIKRTEEKIYPWNFKKVIDLDETAKNFIYKSLNKCTYIPSCYCLAKNSLLFSYFNVLNNLNKTYINGRALTYEEKHSVIESLFKNKRKVTKQDFIQFFKAKTGEDILLSTSNNKEVKEFDFDMASYVDFKTILGEEFLNDKIDLIENIIRDIVVFEDKTILEKRLKNVYNIVNEKVIKKIKCLNYSKYASISKELLTEIKYVDKDNDTGEVYNVETIISVMEKNNQNLQEVLYDERYGFINLLREYNKKNGNNINYSSIEDYVNDLGMVSPGMKRPMIQAYKICEEIEKILGQRIDEYYVECTRTNRDKNKKKTISSRQEKLLTLYSDAIKVATGETLNRLKELRKEISDFDASVFRSDKYYLYFLQLGRCMYTGNPIDISQLDDDAYFNIDHIYPQSLIKDDSFNNRVLVETTANETKKDIYPIPQSMLWKGNPRAARAFYDELEKIGFLSKEKHKRLVAVELTETELESFVNRQLVYTNQAVKGFINAILAMKSTDSFTPKVIYAKGENVSDFRKKYDIVKSRNVNNFHHAHDAYLNIIVGRTVDVYFKKYQMKYGKTEYLKWMHQHGFTTNVMHIFDQNNTNTKENICEGKGMVWCYDDNKSLKEVKHNIYERFDIFSTERTYSSNDLFGKTAILPARIGNVPIKESGALSNCDKYGGFKQYTFGFYTLIKVDGVYILEAIPTVFKNNTNKYLSSKYTAYETIINCLNTNTIFYSGKLKYAITGRSNDCFVVKNKNERIFDKSSIHTIKKIEKLVGLVKQKITGHETIEDIQNIGFNNDENHIIVSPARNERTMEVRLDKKEIIDVYDLLINMFRKDIYSFSSSLAISKLMFEQKEKFIKLSILGQCRLIINVLDFLKCNMRVAIDLSLINGSKSSGVLTISKRLKNCKIVFESITGYYQKTVVEIK